MFLHNNNYEYGSYCWEIDKKSDVILPFWFKNRTDYEVGYFAFSPQKVDPKLSKTEPLDNLENIVKLIPELWSQYSYSDNLSNPYFKNLYYLMIYSSNDSLSELFDIALVNDKFNLNSSVTDIIQLFPVFLKIVDCILYELDLTHVNKYVDIKQNIEITALNDSESEGLSFETEINVESDETDSDKNESDKAELDSKSNINENKEISKKYDNQFLLSQNVISLKDSDIEIYFKKNAIYFLNVFINFEKISPNKGFVIGFIEYIDIKLINYTNLIKSKKLTYLQLESVYNISFLFAKTYIYKFYSDNFIQIILNKNTINLDSNTKSFLTGKYKSLSIFIITLLKPIMKLSPDYFNGFTINQLCFYYFNYFSSFKNIILIKKNEISCEDIDVYYQDEMEKIKELDASFFFYLAEFIPYQINMIKN